MFFRRSRHAMSFHGSDPPRSMAIDLLHVFVLASLALTQPIYDRLGDRPAFLIDLGIRPPGIFLGMAAISLGLPTTITMFECLAWLCGPRAREAIHAVMIYLLMLLLALPVAKHLNFLPGAAIFGGALVAAAVLAWSYFEVSRVRMLVTHCGLGIVVFPAVFLSSPAATGILFPPQSPRPGQWNPVPTVVLVLDELCTATLTNADREIDPLRFPNLAELSRQATWFRNATTVHAHTEQAVPAILSGKYPTTTWTPVAADRPQNLFSVLDTAAGYEMAVFEPVTSLAPKHRIPADFEPPGLWQQVVALIGPLSRVYLFHVAPHDYHINLPPIPDLWYGLRDTHEVDRTMRRGVFRYGWTERRDQQVDHFLNCLSETSDPTLYFMHLLLPHVPWSYLPSGRRYTEDFDECDLMNYNSHSGLLAFWGQDDWLVVQSQQRYLLQLAYLDRLIGRMVERLKETGLFDRCLLIVTADHGVAFRANSSRREIAAENLGDILPVPLLIKRPFQISGEVSDRHIESVDILPTIADVLGIKLSEPTDGCSVFEESAPERRMITFFQDRSLTAVNRAAVATSDLSQILRQRFGDPRDPQAMFRVGPIPELIGRQIDSLVQEREQSVEIELLRYGDVVSESAEDLLPCFFEGRVRAAATADQPTVLAVAINGTIQAVTRTYRLEGFRERWAALVPESSFRPGKNDVQFFAVTGAGPDWRLSRCTGKVRVK